MAKIKCLLILTAGLCTGLAVADDAARRTAATVNDRPIYEDEIFGAAAGNLKPAQRQRMIEQAIDTELTCQAALAEGFAESPVYVAAASESQSVYAYQRATMLAALFEQAAPELKSADIDSAEHRAKRSKWLTDQLQQVSVKIAGTPLTAGVLSQTAGYYNDTAQPSDAAPETMDPLWQGLLKLSGLAVPERDARAAKLAAAAREQLAQIDLDIDGTAIRLGSLPAFEKLSGHLLVAVLEAAGVGPAPTTAAEDAFAKQLAAVPLEIGDQSLTLGGLPGFAEMAQGVGTPRGEHMLFAVVQNYAIAARARQAGFAESAEIKTRLQTALPAAPPTDLEDIRSRRFLASVYLRHKGIQGAARKAYLAGIRTAATVTLAK